MAANVANDSETTRSMVLALRDGDETRYFTLSRNCGDGRSSYSICPWPTGTMVGIQADVGAAVPDVFVSAVTRGIPIPRDGSLFGWKHGDAVTALIAVYAEYEPLSPDPCWSVMPLVGSPEAQWPPFTGEPLIGNCFWELHQAGKVVSVESLIAATSDTVFWADTDAVIGSGCCVVARDIRSPEGYTLQSGRYVYYKALRTGAPMPSLQALLAGTGKTDLATQF
jgi:hypothetical protein